MPNPVGPLTPADEMLTQQVVEMFAAGGTSDPGWKEKFCTLADGSRRTLYCKC